MSDLVILGAHTALGEALWEALDDRDLSHRTVRATTADRVESGHVLMSPELFEPAKALFLTFDETGESEDRLRAGLVSGRARLPAPMVDLAGILDPGDAPIVFPLLDRVAGPSEYQQSGVRLPLGLVGPLVATLRALEPFQPTRARIVTFEGVAGRGHPGIEELREQARSLFTGVGTEPEVFEDMSGFTVASALSDPDDPFLADESFRLDLEAGLQGRRLATRPLSVSRTRVPVFSGEGVAVEVELEDPPPLETALDVLEETRGVRVDRQRAPNTLDTVDRDDALLGRVRLEGAQIDYFMCVDRLRAGAAASAALLAEQWLNG